ncbi:hypothetical protein D9M72_530270 [compost metagenome]
MVDAIEHADLVQQPVQPVVRVAADRHQVIDRPADRVDLFDLGQALQRAQDRRRGLGLHRQPAVGQDRVVFHLLPQAHAIAGDHAAALQPGDAGDHGGAGDPQLPCEVGGAFARIGLQQRQQVAVGHIEFGHNVGRVRRFVRLWRVFVVLVPSFRRSRYPYSSHGTTFLVDGDTHATLEPGPAGPTRPAQGEPPAARDGAGRGQDRAHHCRHAA